jgi:acetoin utilization deacetylase AcuC-like enzyme
VRRFFDPAQLAHAPLYELWNGAQSPYADTPERAQIILAAIGGAERPQDRGIAPLLRVHDAAYLDALQRVPDLWREAGRAGDAIPYAFPVHRRAQQLTRVDALLGRHAFDTVTPITPQAFTASYAGAQAALAAAQAVLDGDRAAFALCRPPGHHAGRGVDVAVAAAIIAAVAAQAARDAGVGRVAILDIDYHHGNGTQDIFWGRGDVFFASVHADPATDYPFYWGHPGEAGEGDGHGATLNLPLPHGTRLDAFRRAQAIALDAIGRFDPGLLVVSFGADTWEGDPISHFALTTPDYAVLARDIARADWPTVIVMEGGYAAGALGHNVASFLSGF